MAQYVHCPIMNARCMESGCAWYLNDRTNSESKLCAVKKIADSLDDLTDDFCEKCEEDAVIL